MENLFQLSLNGQELQQGDVNLIATNSSLADDRVLAEFLRLSPYDGSTYKAVVPYGYAGAAQTPTLQAAVQAQSNTGSVTVMPLRVLVGSRSGQSGVDQWRDIRSAVFAPMGANGVQVTLNPNSSGSGRWDIVYLAVSVGAVVTSSTRFVKDPSSGNVTQQPVTTVTNVSVSALYLAGTPGSGTAPAVPSDTSSTFYVPLATLFVPNGFTSTSTLARANIVYTAPTIPVHRLWGVRTHAPGSVNSTLSTVTSWTRPETYLPAAMVGSESRTFLLDLNTPALSSGVIIDNTTDWRNRYFEWRAQSATGAGTKFASGGGTVGQSLPTAISAFAKDQGFGQSYFDDTSGTVTNCNGTVFYAAAAGTLGATNAMYVYVDNLTGAMRVFFSGTPGIRVFLKVEATAPFLNY